MKPPSARRRAVDRLSCALMFLALAIAVIPLMWILFEVARQGLDAIRGIDFFTEGPPGAQSAEGGGVANGILGTLIMVGLATGAGVPAGILGAIYLVEYAPGSPLARSIRFLAEVMTGIPAIVFGIFIYALVVIATRSFSALAGSVALALIMWPVVLRTTEEMLRLVPTDVKEASLALGIPKWRTILKVVLPTAAAGITTGSMLAVARAAGETAPLLFTALGNQFISFDIDRPMSALPLEIFRGATTAFDAANERAWAAAATLIVLVLVLTLGARALTPRTRVGA